MSLQQGGLGLVMTTLIVTAPPMAASFFQGVLGQFSPYSAMGGGGAAVPAGPGGSYVPRQQSADSTNQVATQQDYTSAGRVSGSQAATNETGQGKMGKFSGNS
ncbi:hypothetical protein OCJ37_08175 [Xanthomonas sp. AM6]|nr:hypothetical protein OCJ37_08175 [Xanthomonas sp. AM6]